MLLDMSNVDKLQFQFINRIPVKARFRLQVREGDSLHHLLLFKSQIFKHFVLGERHITIWIVVLFPGNEILLGILQIEMHVEDGVIGLAPEFKLIPRGILDRLRAVKNDLFEHGQRGEVLRLDGLLDIHICAPLRRG